MKFESLDLDILEGCHEIIILSLCKDDDVVTIRAYVALDLDDNRKDVL